MDTDGTESTRPKRVILKSTTSELQLKGNLILSTHVSNYFKEKNVQIIAYKMR